MDSLGGRLRHYREARQMTLDALATGSGLSKSMLSKLETGGRETLALDRAVAICDALGISLDDLAGRDVTAAVARRKAAIERVRRLTAELREALNDLE